MYLINQKITKGLRLKNMKIELISKYPKENQHPVPILFVHGAFVGAWCWDEYFLPYFAEHGYAAHALSLRGHGKSEGGDTMLWLHSIIDYMEDLSQCIQKLGTPPILVGHSMGGLIVQKYLESFEMPAGILLASVPHTGFFFNSARMCYHYPCMCQKICLINMLPKNMWEYVTSLQEIRDLFFSHDVNIETIKKYFPLFQRESYRAMSDMTWISFLPQPSKVKRTPLFVLGAEDDIIIPPEFVKSTAMAYNAECCIFSQTAHAMMLDHTWKNAADKILEWLKEKGF